MNWRRLLFLLTILIVGFESSNLAIAQQSSELAAGIELSDGTQLEGLLRSIDNDTASFVIDGNDRSFSIKSINQIRFSDPAGNPSDTSKIVKLVDGSTLICKSVKLKDRKLQATTECDIEFKSNTRLIDFFRFTPKETRLEKLWNELVEQDRESDALIVVRDQKLQTVDGVIGDLTAETVSFTVGERTAEVKRNRISGLLFYRRTTDEFAPALCIIELTDGSKIQVRSISIKDQTIEVNSVAGMSIALTTDAIATIDFGTNRSVWLTDLDPATNDWVPLIASPSILGSLKQFSIARIDKSFSGKSLAVVTAEDEFESGAGFRKEYSKGFAIKGGGKLSFLLAKQYRRLTGLIAFDPDANATGTVKFIMQLDGKNRIEKVLDAPTLREPFEIDVELTGADRIVFQVEYHDRRSVGDILHAVEMKLHR